MKLIGMPSTPVWLALLLFIPANAQKIKEIQKAYGETSVSQENDMTFNETCKIVRQHAMIDVINNKFGSFLEQQTKWVDNRVVSVSFQGIAVLVIIKAQKR